MRNGHSDPKAHIKNGQGTVQNVVFDTRKSLGFVNICEIGAFVKFCEPRKASKIAMLLAN
jgi:hypothetical protein